MDCARGGVHGKAHISSIATFSAGCLVALFEPRLLISHVSHKDVLDFQKERGERDENIVDN